MAPEQLVATDPQAGPQSDVYGLGVVLYELLTDRRFARQRSGDVPPPSTLDPAVPAALDAVCLRALAEVPADRFSSAAEFARAIRGAVGRNRGHRAIPVLAALASALLVLAVAFYAGWKFFPPRGLAESQRSAAGTVAEDGPPKPPADGPKDASGSKSALSPKQGVSPSKPKSTGSARGTGWPDDVTKLPAPPQSPEDIAALVEDLESTDVDRILRATVRFMRGKPREPSPAVSRALERVLLEDGFPRIRANAAQGLQNWGTPETIPALEEAARRDPDANVRTLAKAAVEAVKLRQ
jgi:serine/threonine protein kinase